MEKTVLIARQSISRLESLLALSEHAKVDIDRQPEFLIAYGTALDIYTKFEAANDQTLLDESNSECLELLFSHIVKIDSLFNKIKAAYKCLTNNDLSTASLSPPSLPNNTDISASDSQSNCNVKLPRINLPTFSGELKSWPNFHDLFNTLIHENQSLSNIEKFQYLYASLSGEPHDLIKHLPLTSGNYIIAWNLLTERYQNDRVLVSYYWQSMSTAPKVTTDSVHSLRALLNTFTENVHALDQHPNIDLWDFTLFRWFLEKLDTGTRKRFEVQFCQTNIPKFHDLKDFVSQQCRALETDLVTNGDLRSNQNSRSHVKVNQPYQSRAKSLVANVTQYSHSTAAASEVCPFCKASHRPYKCPTFIAKTCSDRQAAARQARLCFNCLRKTHMISRCTSTSTCRICSGKHHTLLHQERSYSTPAPAVQSHPGGTQVASAVNPVSAQANVSSHTSVLLSNSSTDKIVLLSTAVAEICDGTGEYKPCRILLDPGSQASFIVDSCARRLRLPRSRSHVSVFGLGDSNSNPSCGLTTCHIRSRINPDKEFTVDTIILPKICADLPNSALPSQGWSYLYGIQLADPSWNKPAPIDILLGADVYTTLLHGSQLSPPDGIEGPCALNTWLGWVLLGPTPIQRPVAVNSFFASLDFPIEETIRKFWEIEQVNPANCFSAEERRADDIFKHTHTRDQAGRFSVCLPFKTDIPKFGNTIAQADRRLASLERRLSSQPALRQLYVDFMDDYLTAGHMSLLEPSTGTDQGYFIPHHCVLKTSGDSQKIRVVFDASAKDDAGLSLNDTQLIGPKLQADISSVLLSFRSHQFVFTCDVRQMFRQIRVMDEHCSFQLIRWRFSLDQPIQTYKLNTVTYGVSSSPFLAIRTLLQLASDGAETYPLASEALKSSLYVDDLVCGAASISEALNLQRELIELLDTGCFELRKWSSNHPALLENIPPSHCQSEHLTFDGDTDTVVKVLGLQWQSSHDCFSFEVKPTSPPCTKRAILSEVARIYDPLGFLCPLTLFAKRLIQHLWTLGVGWDEPPPEDVCARWNHYKSQLGALSSIKIPRALFSDTNPVCQLHAFCDSSEVGYACVVYFRLADSNDHATTRLVMAKSKVAPVKRLSIPRLELCAAVLLSNLVDFVLNVYKSKVNFEKIFAWSDSTVALHWIRSSPHRWKTFVANRVSHIQDRVPPECWRHISSLYNPADPASRGLLPESMVSCSLWWAGPPWLSKPSHFWPEDKSREAPPADIEERRIVLLSQTSPTPLDSLLEKFSSLHKIQAIVAYCIRFSRNCQKGENVTGHLTQFEYHRALMAIVKQVQAVEFAKEISDLQRGRILPKQFQRLNPFLDENGILRVGGRLSHSKLPYETRHPALLPSKHKFTELIIRHTHLHHLHPGQNTTYHLILQNFWVMGARRIIRSVLSKCQRCFRLKPTPLEPQMGDLPAPRVSQAKAFSIVGVDFAGPFRAVSRRSRGVKPFKCYLCLFVCFATKALHLELASDLSTPVFLAALRRFIARRGRCSTIFSDCGTNFVGANRELMNDFRRATESEAINWQFNPPSSPHFGGLWESGVKSVKTHIFRVIGNQILTLEELNTLIIQIEALLNSRPLCALSSDPNDLQSLTPGHFLTLEPLTAPPDPDLSHLSLSRLSRWQLIQQLQQSFWSRWRDEYLHTLYQRGKWYASKSLTSADAGTLVLIKDDNLPPLKWKLGRIVAIHPGRDGIARVATVKTDSGTFKRPCIKLCPLPNQ